MFKKICSSFFRASSPTQTYVMNDHKKNIMFYHVLAAPSIIFRNLKFLIFKFANFNRKVSFSWNWTSCPFHWIGGQNQSPEV